MNGTLFVNSRHVRSQRPAIMNSKLSFMNVQNLHHEQFMRFMNKIVNAQHYTPIYTVLSHTNILHTPEYGTYQEYVQYLELYRGVQYRVPLNFADKPSIGKPRCRP